MTKKNSPLPAPVEMQERIRVLALELKLVHLAATLTETSSLLTNADPPEALLERLLSEEVRVRRERRIERLIRASKLPERKLLSDFDFDFQPSINKPLVQRLATMDFVRHGHGVIFGGSSGTGKSYMAKAIGLCGCVSGYNVRYTTAAAMLTHLHSGLADDTIDDKLKAYLQPDLLICDELGFDRLEQETPRNAALFFKVMDGRYRRIASTIITTNIGFEALGNILVIRSRLRQSPTECCTIRWC